MDVNRSARKNKLANTRRQAPHEFLAALASVISKHDALGYLGAYNDSFLTSLITSIRYLLTSTVLQMTGMNRSEFQDMV